MINQPTPTPTPANTSADHGHAQPAADAPRAARIASMRRELTTLAHTTARARQRRRFAALTGLALIAAASTAAAILARPMHAATSSPVPAPIAAAHASPAPTLVHAPRATASRIEILTARPATSIVILTATAPTTIEYIDDPTLITLADAAGSPLGTARIDNRLSVVYRTRER